LKKTLVNDFNYLVTPIVFDVKVSLESLGFEIDFAYGGDEDEIQGSRLLHF
jgi:hypothetical protein